MLYIDANSVCDWAMSECIHCDEIKFDKSNNFEDIFKYSGRFGYWLFS